MAENGMIISGGTLIMGADATGAARFMKLNSDGTMPIASVSLQTTADLSQAVVNTASSGDNSIVAAVAAQKTRVYRMRLYVAAAVTVTVKNGAGATLEVIPFTGAGSLVLDFSDRPYYATSVNTAFILNLSGAVQVNGVVEYVTS